MYQRLITFVCICCFCSQVFANDQQTKVYELDELSQTNSSQLVVPLIQTMKIDQTAEKSMRQTFSEASGKIKVRYPRQIFLNKTVPFTPVVIQTMKKNSAEYKRWKKSLRPDLMWHMTSPTPFHRFNWFNDQRLLMSGAMIYDWSAKD